MPALTLRRGSTSQLGKFHAGASGSPVRPFPPACPKVEGGRVPGIQPIEYHLLGQYEGGSGSQRAASTSATRASRRFPQHTGDLPEHRADKKSSNFLGDQAGLNR